MASSLHLLTALALGGPAHALPPGEPVDAAILVQVPPAGLAKVGDVVAEVLPPTFQIEASSGELACADDDEVPLTWALDALDVYLSTDDVRIDTADGRLDLTLFMTLDSSASAVTVSGDCSVLTELDEICDLQLPTTAVEANIGMAIVLDEAGEVDATVDTIRFAVSPVGNPLGSCLLSSAVGTLLGQDPTALSTLIEDLVAPQLADLGPTLESAVEEGLGGLALETEVDALGTPLLVGLEPTLLALDERGLVLGLGGGVLSPAWSTCVDWTAGSAVGETDWADVDGTAGSTSLPHDAALLVGADFVDQLLFSAWAAGLLCIDAGELLEEQAGLSISAGFLGGLLGDSFTTLFPDGTPVRLIIDPVTPPTVAFSDDRPAFVIDPGLLHLELFSELDGRELRVFGTELVLSPGVDVTVVEGALSVALDLDSEDIRLLEVYTDLLDPGYSGGLAGLLDTAISSQLPDGPLVEMALPLPLGLGVDALVWWPSDDARWQGGYLLLDTSQVAPVELGGCSLDGLGCDGGGVSGPELDLDTLLGCSADGGLGCDAEAGCADAACTTAGRQSRLVGVARWRLLVLGGLLLGIVARRRV
jgi:hypothetical protein